MSRVDRYCRAVMDDRVREYWDNQEKQRKVRSKKKGGMQG